MRHYRIAAANKNAGQLSLTGIRLGEARTALISA